MTRQPYTRVRRSLLILVIGFLFAALIAITFLLDRIQVAPRQLGPYLERRAEGHNPAIEAIGRWLKQTLVALDRTEFQVPASGLRLGAQELAAGSGISERPRLVSSVADLHTALANAMPGDSIVLLPGSYRIEKTLAVRRPGTAGAPITVRASLPGTVILEQSSVEGFLVSAPHWRFENLTIRGVCKNDSSCEHAFHIVGGARHFAAVNNTIVDFNAHFKINGHGDEFPDQGLLEANTLTNTRARLTSNPVTPVDLVSASDWTIRRNLISDFVKGGGNRISYGAFAKGGGARNVFEQNIFWCEQRLVGLSGQRVGLSLGGGGTGKGYCRDRACVVEQQQGILRNNLIVSCSDVGIYLNNAAQSSLQHNTVIDTAGVDVRFAGSSADLEGNLIDGPIRNRQGGVVRERDNISTTAVYAYFGYHPVRAMHAERDFAWKDRPLRRETTSGIALDLCSQPRAAFPAYGAFESFEPCIAVPTPAKNTIP